MNADYIPAERGAISRFPNRASVGFRIQMAASPGALRFHELEEHSTGAWIYPGFPDGFGGPRVSPSAAA